MEKKTPSSFFLPQIRKCRKKKLKIKRTFQVRKMGRKGEDKSSVNK